MRIERMFGALLSAIVLLLIACGGAPDGTVKTYYEYLNRGEYSKAKEMWSAELKMAEASGMIALAGGFSNFAEQETKRGNVKEVRIRTSQIHGEGATVNYEVVYKGGSSRTRAMSLAKEKGSWKVGIIN